MEKTIFTLTCPKCGGPIVKVNNQQIATCEECNSLIPLPSFLYKEDLDASIKLNILEKLNRACSLQLDYQFHRAYNIYDKVSKTNEQNGINDFYPYWCKVLSQYGVMYQLNDHLENEVVCYRASMDSIYANPNYKKALEYASLSIQTILKKEAQQIEDYLKLAYNALYNFEPVDVCLYVDDSDDNPSKIKDLKIVEDVKKVLASRNCKTFVTNDLFAYDKRLDLEKTLFAAIESSSMMIVVSSSLKHFSNNLFRNTWMRYLRHHELKETINNRFIVMTDLDPEAVDEKELGITKEMIINTRDHKYLSYLANMIDCNVKFLKYHDQERLENACSLDEITSVIEKGNFEEAKGALNILVNEDDVNYAVWWNLYLVKNKIQGVSQLDKKIIDPRLDYYYQMTYKSAPRTIKKKLYDYMIHALDKLQILDEVDSKYEEELVKYQKEEYRHRRNRLIRDFGLVVLVNIVAFLTLSLGNVISIIMYILSFGTVFSLALRQYVLAYNSEKLPVGLKNEVDVRKYYHKIKTSLPANQAARLILGSYAKKIKVFANILLIICSIITAGFVVKEVSYKIINNDINYYYFFNRVIITGGNNKDIIIPTKIGNKKVYRVKDRAFYKNNKLETITFNNGVVKIGNDAFANCENLKEVILPASLQRVGESGSESFRDSTSIEVIYGVKAGISYRDLFGENWEEKMHHLKTENGND